MSGAGAAETNRWSRRRLGWTVAAIVLLNALFLLFAASLGRTSNHLTLSLDGNTVRATFDGLAVSEWDGAPLATGALGVSVHFPYSGELPVGIDNLVVRSMGSDEVLLEERFGLLDWWSERSGDRSADEWHIDPFYRQLTSASAHTRGRSTTVWIDEVSCGDCTIDVDLINARDVDLYVRSDSQNRRLSARWENGTLSWQDTSGQQHGVARLPLSSMTPAKRQERFSADLAEYLLPGYESGWRFFLSYLRLCLPGLLAVTVLGAVWRLFSDRQWRAPKLPLSFAQGWIVVATGLGVLATGWILFSLPDGTWFESSTAVRVATAWLVIGFLGGVGREIVSLRQRNRSRYERTVAFTTFFVVGTIAAAAAGFSAFVSIEYLEKIPHVQDSASYLLAAKAITAGGLTIPVDPELAPFFELGHFFRHIDGHLLPIIPGYYFAGHPLLLAAGEMLDAPWVINPITSGITLILLFVLARELFDTGTGLIVVVLGAISPFARFQSASMMTHPSALLAVTTALLFLVLWIRRRRLIYAFCLGLTMGVVVNVRVYDGLVLGLFVILVLLASIRRMGWRSWLAGVIAMMVTFVPFVVLIVWQMDVMSAEKYVRATADRTVAWHAENVHATVMRLYALNEDLFGWPRAPGLSEPYTLTVGLLLFAILVIPKTRADWFVVGWAILYIGGYLMHNWHGNMYGPRYWYSSLGGQLILTARLFQILPGMIASVVRAIWPPGRRAPWRWVPLAVGVIPMLILVEPLFRGTLRSYPRHYRRIYSGGYNGFSTDPLKLVERHGVRKGLIFLADTPKWQDLVTVIAANDPSLNGPLIFARHIEGESHRLIAARPGHQPYVIAWNGTELELGRVRPGASPKDLLLEPIHDSKRTPYVIGQSNVFSGVSLGGGIPLVGGIATNSRGDIYVLSEKSHEVLIFDRQGILRRRIQASYSFGPSAINRGDGIAADDEGNVYVVDGKPAGLLRFNPDGSFAWRARQSPDGSQVIRIPYDVAILPDGNLIVTDGATSRTPKLHVVRPDGTFAGYFGPDGGTRGLERPMGIEVGPNGHVFVADPGREELVELDADGVEIHAWKMELEKFDPQNLPYVAIDQDGDAFVVDTKGWVVYRARPGTPKLEALPTSIQWPSGIVALGNKIFVVEGSKRRLVEVKG